MLDNISLSYVGKCIAILAILHGMFLEKWGDEISSFCSLLLGCKNKKYITFVTEETNLNITEAGKMTGNNGCFYSVASPGDNKYPHRDSIVNCS